MAATGIGSGSGGSALVPSPVPKSLPSSQFQRLLTSVSDVLQAQWVPIAPLISLICEYSFFSGNSQARALASIHNSLVCCF